MYVFLKLDVRRLFLGEIWRIVTSQYCFSSTVEAVSGLILIYNLRVFERMLGSKKFAAFLTLSWCVTVASEMAMSILCSVASYRYIAAPGPFFFIYALLPMFHRKNFHFIFVHVSVVAILFFYAGSSVVGYLPKNSSIRFTRLGIEFSDKTFTYIIAAQLVFYEVPSSLLPVAVSIVFGYLYSINAFRLQQIRLPRAVEVHS